ncbi:hypothetical protein PHMEG_00027753 [Phytophthora megakarya]|uniref:Uncharacterized protein n=1 Tax=Phytophthora megakarya TaxID=4795 RepID=A0A225V6I6_9STRA|nr:hypothetical protein PHMEG_00027753 [Phytophthora megakarya]
MNKKSKSIYAYALSQTPAKLSDQLNEVRETDDTLLRKEKNERIKCLMKNNLSLPPVDLTRITLENIECFLMSIRKKDGKDQRTIVCRQAQEGQALGEDVLAVWFTHVKNDQEDDRQRDPRHTYANPKKRIIYSILALAIYFTVFGFSSNSLLFNNHYDRYSKFLQKTTEITLVTRELEVSDRVKSDFGSHSARKVSSSDVSGCWTVRFEIGGDSFGGHFDSGLPYETSDFAILPPFVEG